MTEGKEGEKEDVEGWRKTTMGKWGGYGKTEGQGYDKRSIMKKGRRGKNEG